MDKHTVKATVRGLVAGKCRPAEDVVEAEGAVEGQRKSRIHVSITISSKLTPLKALQSKLKLLSIAGALGTYIPELAIEQPLEIPLGDFHLHL